MKYSIERMNEWRRSSWKYRHDATMFNWTTCNCRFETSSDKLQNVSQSSLSAVL